MINITFISLSFLFLSYQNIILINEESLILLCFVVFIWIVFNNFKDNLTNYFDFESGKIKFTLQNSLKQFSIALKQFSTLKINSKVIYTKFKTWGTYYYNVITILGYKIPKKNKQYLFSLYIKRLSYINKIEQQTIKLLTFIIIQKVNKIIKLKQFYNLNFKIKYFNSLNAICIREAIKNVLNY